MRETAKKYTYESTEKREIIKKLTNKRRNYIDFYW